MFCKNCGAQFADGEKFCRNCGTPVEKISAEPKKTEQTMPVVQQTLTEKVVGENPEAEEKVSSGKEPEAEEKISLSKEAETEEKAMEKTDVPTQKFCKGCGQPLAEGVKFCKVCGKPAENTDSVSADAPTAVIPPLNGQPTVNQSTVPTQTYGTPYAAAPTQPKLPRKPLPKKALIGIIAGGVALVAIIVVIVVMVSIANDPVNKMLGYIDSGSTTEAKQLYASSFKYNEDNLARLEAEVIKKVEEIEKQYADGTLTEEEAYSKLNVICAMSSYDIYKYGYEGKEYIEALNDSEEYYEKANGYKDEGNYLKAVRYYGYVAEDTPKYEAAQAAITECLNAYVQEVLNSAAEYANNGNYSYAISTLQNAVYDLDSDTQADFVAQLNKQIEVYQTERTKAFEDAMKAKVESEGYIAAIDDIYDIAWDMGVSLDSDTYNTMVDQYKTAYMDEALSAAQTLANNGDYSAAATVLMRADEDYYDEFWGHLDALTEKANEYAEKVFSFNDLSDLVTKSTGLDLPSRNDSGIANYPFEGVDGLDQYMYAGFSATYRDADVVLNLGKGYTSLKGMASFEEDNEADDITITFVGDGKSLKSITLSKDHDTEEFEIDLTGISSLSISVRKTSSSSYADAYLALVNTVVTKAEAAAENSAEENSEASEASTEA